MEKRMRKSCLGLIAAVNILAVVILTGAQAMAAARLNVNLWPEKVSEFKFTSPGLRETVARDMRNFVSITPLMIKIISWRIIRIYSFSIHRTSPSAL